MGKTKEKRPNYEKQVTFAVREMVEFMKSEVDKSVAHLINLEKIEKQNAESVSSVIKSSIEASMIKAIGTVQRSVR